MQVEAISTGSLGLDMALGVGGVPRGRIVEVYGPESSGKTTLALHILAEAQKKGGDVAFIDVEHALDPVYAEALGVEKLVDWNDWFSAEEMEAYVPGFVQDGVIAGKQIVFPVSKSTQLLFLNGSQYARFAADTGAQLEKLDTWDGFLRWLPPTDSGRRASPSVRWTTPCVWQN